MQLSEQRPTTRRGWSRRVGFVAAGVALPVALVCALALRGPRADAGPAVGDVRDVPREHDGVIEFSSAFAKRAGLEIATAKVAPLVPVVKVVGTVGFDPRQVGAVGARIPGFVRRVLKLPGDVVRAGEALAEIESADVGRAQADVAMARAEAQAAQKNAAREAALLDQRLTTAREAEVARAALDSHAAALAAAEQRVAALGGIASSGGKLGVVVLRAPLAGTVVESHLSVGQTVEPNLVAFRVANLDRVWIELAAYEHTVRLVREGDLVEVTPLGEEQKIRGKVAHVGDVLDLETRSADVRVQVDNRDRLLRPGQSVTAVIRTSRPARDALAVPASAITFVDGKPTVFVARSATSVSPRSVTLGLEDGSRQEIVRGVAEGERVVARGVFELKSELFR